MIRTTLLATALAAASFAAQAQTETFAPSKTGNISTHNVNFGQSFLVASYSNNKENIGFLQFDLSSLDASKTYEAKLDLHQYGASVEGSYWVLFAITESWSANISRWNQRPAFNEDFSSEFSIDDSNTGVWREANVSEFVNAWVSGGMANHGFMLMRGDKPNPGTFFGASDTPYSFAPRLVITSAVPEPSTYALMAMGLALTGFTTTRARRQRG